MVGGLHQAASFERDYLLPAPSVNLRGCRRAELKYDQGYTLQNRVLREFQIANSKMFQRPVTNFWTPHSGRTYMPTATQVLAFPKEERDFLGGWLAQAGDRYARTARRKIANMQRTVAREIRTKSAGRLAEEETSRSLQDFLETEGLPEAERNENVKRLEDWSSFATDALPAVPQLEQQEEGDEEVQAVQESETVPTERLERPDKRRKEQSTRTEIFGVSGEERLVEKSVSTRFPRVRIEQTKGHNVASSGCLLQRPRSGPLHFRKSRYDMPHESAYDNICALCSRKGVAASAAESDRSLGSSSTEPEN